MTVLIPTRAGIFTARFSGAGLAKLAFPNQSSSTQECRPSVECETALRRKWSALTKAGLEAVLIGELPGELPPLDVCAGTDFQKCVWSALRRIPAGQTKSYSEIAAEIGSAKATRAVGQACGANPIPVLIPCHRVLAAGGKLGGFSGGLDWKRRLLSVEGVLSQPLNGETQRRFSL